MKIYSKALTGILLFAINITLVAQLKLPKYFSDGMILQRDAEVKIWGWSEPGENITLSFIDSTYQTIVNDNGEWSIFLAQASAGGPHIMEITGLESITIKDILFGDVWVCSGQSNMETNMLRVSPLYEKEISNSTNNYIRQFYVPREYNFQTPQNDFSSGSWISADPNTIYNFSAVGYFFANELYSKYQIPIGIINTALGGSPIQAWMSEDALKDYPDYYQEAQKFKSDSLINKLKTEDANRSKQWYSELNAKDDGFNTDASNWFDEEVSIASWKSMQIPGYWSDTEFGEVNGSIWFKKNVEIPSELNGKQGKLLLGRIVDADSVYVNGQFVGTTSYQYPPRRYNIPQGLLKTGQNNITVRVVSNRGRGGFILDKPYKIIIDSTTIDLKGEWKLRLGGVMKPLESQTFIRWKSTGLFNSMLHPLLNHSVKGVVWYQGESNTKNPDEYYELLPSMINDWRKQWGDAELPFIYAQLPNYMKINPFPSESNWAETRDAQKNALSLLNTAMAVTIDLGEWNDVHPLNKKDVGKRLALGAFKTAYGETDIVYSGPIYKSHIIDGDKIVLKFSNIGSGLIAKGVSGLKEFAIAGADKKFVWANARIINDKIVVWNNLIVEPKYVRYAWADNPSEANLYNKEGLPASPFKTDK